MTNNTVLLIFTDGRGEYFSKTFQSFEEKLAFNFSSKTIIDDSGDPNYASWLDVHYKNKVDYIQHNKQRLGFGGTIRQAWLRLNSIDLHYNFVFHLEDDFTFTRRINLNDLILILKKNPNMAQVCLLRQPWNGSEINAGGIWQQFPDRFKECSVQDSNKKVSFLTHREWFSTNPSLYPKWVVDLGWPQGEDSEEVFSNEKILANLDTTCCYFGSKSDPPAVWHIGYQRMGTKY